MNPDVILTKNEKPAMSVASVQPGDVDLNLNQHFNSNSPSVSPGGRRSYDKPKSPTAQSFTQQVVKKNQMI